MALPNLEALLEQKKLPGLDGFRMVAVMAVVLAHSGVGTLFFSARHGVAGFFVLSGFLITWLLLKEHAKTGTVSFRKFYMRRSLRIFPAYYAFLLVSISWDLFRGNDDIKEAIVPGLFYFMNYHNALEGHSSSSIAHVWSLAIEEQFYLIWPMLFVFLMRRGREYAVAFLIIASLVVLAWRSYSYTYLEYGPSYAYNAFDTRFDNLALGCLLAFLAQKPRWLSVFNSISSRFWMPFIPLGLLFLSKEYGSGDYAYGPAFTVDALLLSILLLQLIRLSSGAVWGWLNHPVSVYLGVISYPIYLWHVWGLQAGDKLNFLPEWLQLLAGVILSGVLASASYHFLEKRFLRLKHRYEVVGAKPGRSPKAGNPSGMESLAARERSS